MDKKMINLLQIEYILTKLLYKFIVYNIMIIFRIFLWIYQRLIFNNNHSFKSEDLSGLLNLNINTIKLYFFI